MKKWMPWGILKVLCEKLCTTVIHVVPTQSSECLSHWLHKSKICVPITHAVPTNSPASVNLLYLLTGLYDYHTCCTYLKFYMTITLAVPAHSSAWLSQMLYLLTALYNYHKCCSYLKIYLTITLAVPTHSSDCHKCCTYSKIYLTITLAVPTQSSTWLSHLLHLLTALYDYHTCC
jgi:hypothetical protein